MAELWDKRADESKAAHEALMDYLRMGVKRSLRGLISRYSKQTSTKPPTTKLNTISTWSNKFEWQKRAQAYDIAQQKKLDAKLDDERKKLVAAELADYKAELMRFRQVRSRAALVKEEQVSEVSKPDPDDSNKTIITRTIVESVDVGSHIALTKWRLEISALGRRANGMPEKITEAHIDDSSDSEKKFKMYIGISPDDWDDDISDADDSSDSAV